MKAEGDRHDVGAVEGRVDQLALEVIQLEGVGAELNHGVVHCRHESDEEAEIMTMVKANV